LETGRYDEAVRLLGRATKASATKVRAAELLGDALVRQGRLADARRSYQVAIDGAGRQGGWRARLQLGRVQQRLGNYVGARSLYDQLADAYNEGAIAETDAEGLAAVAGAVAALEYWQDANETFATATKVDPQRVETQTEWARLFLDKYDPGHAEECLRQALKVNPHSAEAHLLLARVRMAQSFDFRAAVAELEAALATNPRLAEAYAFRATLAARDRDWEAAQQDVARALAIDGDDAYALAVRAATAFVADDQATYRRTLSQLRRNNPRHVGHLPVLTELLEWEHRYEEIVALNREALRDNPSYWPAHGVIGLNLLRMGQEEEGLQELRQSWQQDPFNVMVYNTLNLYDEELAREYQWTTRGPLTFRFHQGDQPMLERYLPQLLNKAYGDLARRYRYRPRQTKIEVFASEDHFARRSVGLPRVGVQGICFGQVVVAGGPRATPVNYGQVLWHELAHVFSIQLSRSRVPRWFTEGLAVMEEGRGSPHWTRRDDAALYRWIKAGRMPPVASLNRAFSRARSGAEIGLAYYASAKLVEHINERYGWPKMLAMLRLYGQGQRTPAVVRKVLAVSPEDLGRQFEQATLAKLARYQNNFQLDYGWHYDFDALKQAAEAASGKAAAAGQVAVAALAHGQGGLAEQWAQRALKLDGAQPQALHVLSDIAAAKKQWPLAQRHAQALVKQGHDGYALRLTLASAAHRAGDGAGTLDHLSRAAQLDPQQPEPHLRRVALLEKQGRSAEALAALQKAADLNQHDRTIYRKLLGWLAKEKQWDQLRLYGERSLWNDPFSPELHLHLARSYRQGGQYRKAVFEYESALLTKHPAKADIYVELARLHLGRRQRPLARRAVKQALAEDSRHQAASKLWRDLTGRDPSPAAGPSRQRP
jgi:tetratricopeptide (TPR) repeat protein